MKVPLSWLRDYTNIKSDISEIAHQMTMAGTEVGKVTEIGIHWDNENVIVGEIMAINSHPNADKLKIVSVNIGQPELLEVVCGAPNLLLNQKIAFAREGALIQNISTKELQKLKSAKIRGVISKGMICSEFELGISDNHQGILELNTMEIPGTPLKTILADSILETELTPNRPDCLSIIGTAYEISAITHNPIKLPNPTYPVNNTNISNLITVNIENPDHCIRYTATLIKNLVIEPSPIWMQSRLKKCGIRPINNVVDITNYVMLEYGQPLHAFDKNKLKDNHIIIRESKNNEKLITLDGTERKLKKGMLVIANQTVPIALAGIMGGQSTEIDSSTDTVFLESANFLSSHIRSTRTKIGLNTEASYRFERELRHEISILALERATELIVSICGGSAYKGIIDAYPKKVPAKKITLEIKNLNKLLGTNFNVPQIWDVLESLGFSKLDNNTLTDLSVISPLWRSDIKIEEDVIEEFARIYGYDKLPVKKLSAELPAIISDKLFNIREKIRDSLVHAGMNEIISYSVSNIDSLKKTQPESENEKVIKLLNPMDSTKAWLRSNLIANLLETILINQRSNPNIPIRIFEIGHKFLFDSNYNFGDLPSEYDSIVGAITGVVSEETLWTSNNQILDFYDLKAITEYCLKTVLPNISYLPNDHFLFNSPVSAKILSDKQEIGVIGELHNSIVDHFDLQTDKSIFLFELYVPKIIALSSNSQFNYKQASKFPDSKRDISLLIDTHIISQEIEISILENELVTHVYPIDTYTGDDIPENKKSVTYRIVFQSTTKTLDSSEIDNIQAQIIKKLTKKLNITERYSI